VIVAAFAVLLAATLLWAIKHAGFTADPDRPTPFWQSDDSDIGD
jgi:hypothetical protein